MTKTATLPDRLRSIYVSEGANYVQEAAREIERLTAERDQLRQYLDASQRRADALREDADRYRWLKPRLFSADFDYNENGICALVFEMPPHTKFWADCDMTVDAARKGEA